MNHTVDVAQGHKTRGIASFLLVAFSFTWTCWWLAVLARLILRSNGGRACGGA